MHLAEDLKALRSADPGCSTILMGDLETKTVLYVCAEDGLRQEDHDRLLKQAAQAFGPARQARFEAHPNQTGAMVRAMRISPSGSTLFLRHLAAPEEVYALRTTATLTLPETAAQLSEIVSRHAA